MLPDRLITHISGLGTLPSYTLRHLAVLEEAFLAALNNDKEFFYANPIFSIILDYRVVELARGLRLAQVMMLHGAMPTEAQYVDDIITILGDNARCSLSLTTWRKLPLHGLNPKAAAPAVNRIRELMSIYLYADSSDWIITCTF